MVGFRLELSDVECLPAAPCATAKAQAARGREASVACAKASATEHEARPQAGFECLMV